MADKENVNIFLDLQYQRQEPYLRLTRQPLVFAGHHQMPAISAIVVIALFRTLSSHLTPEILLSPLSSVSPQSDNIWVTLRKLA